MKGKADKISDKDFQKEFQELVVGGLRRDRSRSRSTGKEHKTRNRVILLTGVTLGVLFNPWTGQATRDWIMTRVSGENGDGFEEFGETLGHGRRQRLEPVSSSPEALSAARGGA